MGEVADLSLFPLFEALSLPDENLDTYPTPFDEIAAEFESPEPLGGASDWLSDNFFLARRSSASALDSLDFSRARPIGSSSTILGFDSDPDSDGEQIVALGLGQDPGMELEWEEIDARPSAIDDREDGIDQAEIVTRNIDWEVLLAMNDTASSVDEHEDYVYTSEYEVLFGQFQDHGFSHRGGLPAAKSVIEALPSVELSMGTICAVCKDEISGEERATRLPCSHYYHGYCILPWLGIRNTCPVCRYDLPTDDPEYERSRGRAVGVGGEPEMVSRERYDFELLSED